MVNAVQVVTAADYTVIIMYTSTTAATFKLSLGLYSSIVAGTAPTLTAQLLASVSGVSTCSMHLPCLERHPILVIVPAAQNI